MKITYIVGCYPFINITFIHREIESIRRQGVVLDVVSMLRPKEGYVLEEARIEMEKTFYVFPANWFQFLVAHIFFISTRPFGYLHCLFNLISRPHRTLMQRLKTLGHFAIGPYVAWHLRRSKPQHIHAHFADRATVVAFVASRLLGIKHSFTAHAKDIYAEDVFLADKIKTAEFVTTCTKFNQDYLNSLTDEPEKVHLLYHGLDFSDFANLQKTTSKEPLILAIGKLVEKKGFTYLIEACAKLHEQGRRFVCWIIGEGPDRKGLQVQIEQAGLQDFVQLKGNLPYSKVIEALSRATLFTLPCVVAANNDRDGIPNVILEAMASGVPVVSTPISAIPESIIDGETGYLVPSRDSEALASKLAHLLDSPSERERLSHHAGVFVRQKFEVDENVRGIKVLFERHLHPSVFSNEISHSNIC